MRRQGIGRPAQPSLLNTAARTAVIAGTASAVSGRVAANQASKAQHAAAAQAPAAAPAEVSPAEASPAGLTDDVFEQLKKLGELHAAGILTDDEFQAKKAQLLSM